MVSENKKEKEKMEKKEKQEGQGTRTGRTRSRWDVLLTDIVKDRFDSWRSDILRDINVKTCRKRRAALIQGLEMPMSSRMNEVSSRFLSLRENLLDLLTVTNHFLFCLEFLWKRIEVMMNMKV
jgi:hypothetical protein